MDAATSSDTLLSFNNTAWRHNPEELELF